MVSKVVSWGDAALFKMDGVGVALFRIFMLISMTFFLVRGDCVAGAGEYLWANFVVGLGDLALGLP